MSPADPRGPAPDAPSSIRALPPRPNLEFERKQAKALLERVHRGDRASLSRVREQLRDLAPATAREFTLAHAQLAIAREYGFASWPRLVDYFDTLVRHEKSGARRDSSLEVYEGRARAIVAEHRDRRAWVGQFLATFVPRFYGRTVDEVFASPITIDDARLVVARLERFPTWAALVAAGDPPAREPWTEYDSPVMQALLAVRANDLDHLAALVEAHPELLVPPDARNPLHHSLLYTVVLHELRTDSREARRMTDWLVRRGADLTETLNHLLLGHHAMSADHVARLLERGADPAWVAPNGFPVLEHALVRYCNGAAVDLIAQRVAPRRAFWIAAGLGEVEAVEAYVDRWGRPTEAARRYRPDFTALGFPAPSLPDADDHAILWEAFWVACINERIPVLEALLARGFPIDYAAWGQPALHFAITARRVALVEFLVARGADLDGKYWRPHASARELAEWHFRNDPTSPATQRIMELCGGRDPAVVIAAHRGRTSPIPLAPALQQALEAARADALGRGQETIQVEHLLAGLLHADDGLVVGHLGAAGVDLAALRRWLVGRLAPTAGRPDRGELAFDRDAHAAVTAARAGAERRMRDSVLTLNLLEALLASDDGPVAELLRSAGGSLERIREITARGL